VDILGGACVQLVQGRRETATSYGDPRACARRWLNEGAQALHIVNLDGAFGESARNADVIRGLVREEGVFLQLGGGIRSLEDARGWLETGVDRVILSTLAIRDPQAVTRLVSEYGAHRVMAGVDAKGRQVVVKGWQEPAGDYLEWAGKLEAAGAGSLLYTNVDVEGLQQGIRTEPVQRLLGATRVPVVVAGGISSITDVILLRDMGAAGVVLGSAMYSGKIRVRDVLEVCR
jgi:phosphoribosylformimino-5-aminoimidazole carboxamide ribotide isomerase